MLYITNDTAWPFPRPIAQPKQPCSGNASSRDSIRPKVLGEGGMGFGEGRETLSSERGSLPSPIPFSQPYTEKGPESRLSEPSS